MSLPRARCSSSICFSRPSRISRSRRISIFNSAAKIIKHKRDDAFFNPTLDTLKKKKVVLISCPAVIGINSFCLSWESGWISAFPLTVSTGFGTQRHKPTETKTLQTLGSVNGPPTSLVGICIKSPNPIKRFQRIKIGGLFTALHQAPMKTKYCSRGISYFSFYTFSLFRAAQNWFPPLEKHSPRFFFSLKE